MPILKKFENLKEGEKVPLMFDKCVHIMFNNPERMEPITLLISKILEVKYEDIEGRIELLPRNVSKKRLMEKKTEQDIVVRVSSDNKKIILEVNVRKSKYNSVINRNLLYLTSYYGSELKEGDNYDDIESTFLVNFNTFYADDIHKKIFDYYSIRNDEGYELTDKIKILNINIEKCYELLYNESVLTFKNKYERDLFYLCASMVTKSEEEFNECINKIDTRSKVKEIFKEVSNKMNQNEEIQYSYEDFIKEERRINDSILKEEKRNSKEEGRQEGEEIGIKKRNKEIVMNMKNKGLSEEAISQYLDLSLEEIKNIYDGANMQEDKN